ncbi:ergothioneine biosynthesis protein EgtB [Luteimonas huabeiensis]|uniref:ergothioneine biosynthesis protein EgtB n=1 Tax=Luteimonas huabeiensis TaxID=1244513 RepID=UPI000464633A|nr:ergothioneine biosynthesis protein EgtB [Luteimonas huabeiensis]
MHAVPHAAPDPDELQRLFAHVRSRTRALAAPLSAEDAMVQSMPDASPAKWHLAHTTWFIERFVLAARPGYRAHAPAWDAVLNSYYQSLGPAHPRPCRGHLSRPSLDEVLDYRDVVDARIEARLRDDDLDDEARRRLLVGLQHEQQHQELLLTDILHAFSCNPLRPAYRQDLPRPSAEPWPMAWCEAGEEVVEIGAEPWPGEAGFAYDNESPRHRVLVPAHALASRPVSNLEYRAFVEDGGYREPALWLSDGWAVVQAQGWARPLYWDEDLEHAHTLGGRRALDAAAPVCHLSYYEADAYARWAGARLPTEFEWERAAAAAGTPQGHFADDGVLQPMAAQDPPGPGPAQLFGDVWEWTSSAYGPWPGYRPWTGSLGEYNGKFMVGQWVLRGGSCATARGHVRASYRNFFPPHARWQFAGLRLARDP